MNYHKQFKEGYNHIYNKYGKILDTFDYGNQSYTFQYELFKKLNLQTP